MSNRIPLVFGDAYTGRLTAKQGENLATTLVVDCTAELALWPNAVFAVLARRNVPNEGTYAAEAGLAPDAQGAIAFTLTDVETAAAGALQLEFQALQGEVVVKSWILTVNVREALGPAASAKPLPNPPGWAAGVVEAAAGAEAARDQAEGFRDEAAGEADYVRSLSFAIDGDGHLIESRGEEPAKDLGQVVGATGPEGPEGPQGLQGPAGPKGDAGEQGPTGDKGDTGEPGEDGVGVSILGSYETYDALVAAHPTGNVGDAYLVQGDLYVWDAENVTWKNVGNIRGPEGPPGPQGEQGEQGIQGVTGPQGQTGATGAQGIQGKTGAQGPVGPPSNIDAVASRWDFVQTGGAVSIRPATASALRVTASEDCTVTHGEDTYTFVAGVAQDITATEGLNTLTASAGSLTVWYNRDAMDVWDAQMPDEADAGDVVRLDHLVGDRPLGLLTKCVAQQAGTGDPSPDNVRAITGLDVVTAYRNAKNLVTYGNKVGNATVTAAPIPNGVRITSTSTTAYAGFLLPIGDRLVGETITVQGEWLASAANVGGISIFWGTDTGSGTGGAIADIRNTGEAVTVVVPPSTQPETYPHIVLRLYTNRGGTLNAGDYVDYTNVMLEIGGTASAYEMYRIDAFAAALPETVYGLPGHEDVADFVSERIIRYTADMDLTSDLAWLYTTSQPAGGEHYRIYLASVVAAGVERQGLCEALPWLVNPTTAVNAEYCGINTGNGNLFVCIRKDRIAGWSDAWSNADKVGAVKAVLFTGGPVKILYNDSPREIAGGTITIPSLAGTNTVFTDAGGAVTVTGKLSGAGVIARMDTLQKQITDLQMLVTGG